MDDDALAAAGSDGVARRHVDGGDFVRAEDGLGGLAAVTLEGRHGLDERRVIRAKIAEQIVAADLGQAFEEVVGRRLAGFVDAVQRVLIRWSYGCRNA